MRHALRSPSLLLVPACALLAALAAAAPARAAVSITPSTVTVTAPGASAVVTRDPFRLEVRGAGGARALAEVPNSPPGCTLPPVAGLVQLPVSQPACQVQPATADPVAPGWDNPSTPTLYAPLSFLVGTQTVTQHSGGPWGGNLLSGERSGIAFAARRVLRAEQAGDGARLVVSTSDPTGRTLVVTVRPLGDAAIRLSAQADPAAGVVELGDSFASAPDEGFFGFGGRHNAIDQRGQVFSSFVQEQNVGAANGQPGTGPLSLFPNGPAAAYYPQAQFISSRRYGFLLSQPDLARFKLDADRPDAWNVSAAASSLDYVVAPGPAPRAIGTLTALTGRQPLPPRWALEPMLDRLVRNFVETPADYEAKVQADLRAIDRYHLPLGAYRLEGWRLSDADNDGLSMPSNISMALQARVFRELRRRHIHPLVYFRPWVKAGSAPVQQGLVVKTATGEPYYTSGTAGQPIALLDPTNPAAVRFWQAEVVKALDLGADGFMQDFGEQVMFDMRFADGETGATMHNRYPVLFARATREAFDRYERSHPKRSLFFFTRAGYSGLPGAAAYENANFPGDETTDWNRASGLPSLTSDMLSRAIGGAYGFGTDIGGYYDYTSPPTTKELFLRWAEWAALTPVFRLHGSGRTGTHTPWSYDAETVRAYSALSRLHVAAAGLIARLWREAERTGMPITRPLWLQYPDDPAARRQDQEWLLGPDVLVAPVVTKGAQRRTVSFPAGCWRAPQTGRTYRGPRTASVPAPLTQLPYFFRCGTQPFRPLGGRSAAGQR